MNAISPAGRAIARTPFELASARPAPRPSIRAELLAVGKRPRLALVDALRDGVAQRVLRASACDKLLLPTPPLAPGASWALPDFATNGSRR